MHMERKGFFSDVQERREKLTCFQTIGVYKLLREFFNAILEAADHIKSIRKDKDQIDISGGCKKQPPLIP